MADISTRAPRGQATFDPSIDDYPAHVHTPIEVYNKPEGTMESVTMNTLSYPVHKLEPTQSFKPTHISREQPAPFESQTTSRSEYPEYKLTSRPINKPYTYETPSVKMETDTLNRLNYPVHELQPRHNYKPENTGAISTEPFEAKTTTTVAYPVHPVIAKRKREKEEYVKPSGTMDGVSTARAEYPAHALQLRESYKPSNAPNVSTVPFDANTVSNMSYPAHKLDPVKRHEKEEYIKPSGIMDGQSTARSEFPAHDITPRENYKPSNKPNISTVPFDGQTVANLSFPAHKIEAKTKREKEEYIKPSGKMDGQSTARTEFPAHELTPRESYKPSNAPNISTVPFDGQTVANTSFPAHKIEPKTIREKEEYIKPSGKMDGQSTARTEFPAHELTPRDSYKPSNAPNMSTEPFDGRTVAHLSYPVHKIEPKTKREKEEYVKPSGTMDGQSTARTEFPAHEISPRESFKPSNKPNISTIPFDGTTIANMSFPAHKIEPKTIREREEYIKPSGKMDGQSIARTEFPAHELTPRESYKPSNKPNISTDPFDGQTVAHLSFPVHKIEPKIRREKEEYVKPSGTMDGQSTARTEFPAHEITPRENYKPSNVPNICTVPFDGTTTSKTEYPEHRVEYIKRREKPLYIKNEGVMDFDTSSRKDFIEHPLSERKSYKPTNTFQRSEVPFDDATTSKDGFREHPIPPKIRKEHIEYVPPDGRMDGISTSKSEYPAHELSPRTMYKPDNHREILAPFEGNTTAQSDYLKYDIPPPTKNFKPEYTYLIPVNPFDGKTTASTDFTQHTIAPRHIKAHVPYVPPEGKMDGESTNKSVYTEHAITPRTTMKPANTTHLSTEPFDGRTTASLEYTQHKIEPRKRRDRDEYVKVEGVMDTIPTSKAEFPAHELHVRQSCKPVQFSQMSDVPFDDKTTSRVDFPAHKPEQRQLRRKEEYLKPEGIMDDRTCSRADYTEHKIPQRVSFKPTNSAAISVDPFDGATTSRLAYHEHPIAQRQQRVREEYIAPEGKMDGITTNRAGFPGYDIVPRISYKPINSTHISEEPFVGRTTARDDFHEHPIEARSKRAQEEYIAPVGKMDGISTSRAEHTQFDISPRKSYRPKGTTTQSDIPFDDATTSRVDYHQHPIEQKRIRPPIEYVPPEGKMDSKTTSGSDYHYHEINPRISYKPLNDSVKSEVPFEGLTTFREAFTEKRLEKRYKREQQVYLQPEGNFDGVSTNRTDFTVHEIPPKGSYKPQQVAFQSDARFDDQTTSKTDYHLHKIEQKQTITKLPYIAPEGRMDGVSTSRAEYTQHTLDPRKLMRPDQGVVKSDVPFNSQSTARSEYTAHPIEPRKEKLTQQYVPPEGIMDTCTTNKLDYTKHEICPRQSYKPVNSTHNTDGPFYDSTENRDSYHPHALEPRKPAAVRQEYIQPEDKMDSQTVSSRDYTRYDIPPRESCKPINTPYHSDHPFEGTTINKQDFTTHTIEPKKPLAYKQVYVRPDEKMEVLTQNKADYTPHGLCMRQSYKPHNLRDNDNVAFDDSTTFRASYIRHQLEPKKLKEVTNYVRPEEKMEGMTVNKSDFIDFERHPRQSYKPANAALRSETPFEGMTITRQDYQPHEINFKIFKDPKIYIKPEGVFEGISTTKHDYRRPYDYSRPYDLNRNGNCGPPATQCLPQTTCELNTNNNYNSPIMKNVPHTTCELNRNNNYNPPTLKCIPQTTVSDHYRGIYTVPPESCKPNVPEYKNPGPLPGISTFRMDYRQYKDIQLPATGQTIGDTTNTQQGMSPPTAKPAFTESTVDKSTQYDGKPVKVKAYEPIESNVAPIEKPVKKTTNNSSYSLVYDNERRNLSTMRDSYRGPMVPKMIVNKPKEIAFASSMPFDMRTTHREDFKHYPTARRSPIIHDWYRKPTGDIDFNSVTRTSYTEKHATRPPPATQLPSTALNATGRFDPLSTYLMDYPSKYAPPDIVKPHQPYNPPETPMTGFTTSNQAYIDHGRCKRSPIKQPDSNTRDRDPFTAISDYQETYRAHSIPSRFQRDKQPYIKPAEKFVALSTSRRDYRGQHAPSAQAIVPDRSFLQSKEPLESATTHKVDYMPHFSQDKVHRTPEAWTTPPGKFDMQTTSRDAYRDHQIGARLEQKRPVCSGALVYRGKVDSKTNYKCDFVPPIGPGRQNPVKRDAFTAELAPFVGITTHKRDFIQHAGQKTSSCRPATVVMQSKDKFDGTTTYQVDFTPSERIPREPSNRQIPPGKVY